MKPVEKEKIGWGIIGTGRIAKEFAEDVTERVPDGYVAAVGSRTMEHAAEFGSRFNCKAYGSYEEMMDDPDVDIVYVATPHPVHLENVIMAAEHGKNILCEKPFSVNKKEAEQMFAAAEKNGVFIMEGLWSRFFPAWKYAREVIQSGQIGKLISVDASLCWGSPRSGNIPAGTKFRGSSRLFDPNLAGGTLLDGGIYNLAALSVAMGGMKRPKNIYSSIRFTDTGVDGDTDIMLTYEDGLVAHLVSSLHRRIFETNLFCENGYINIKSHRNPDAVTVHSGPISWARAGYQASQSLTVRLPYYGGGFQFETMEVQDCLRKGLRTCPAVPPEETLINMEICDTVRAQNNFKYPFED